MRSLIHITFKYVDKRIHRNIQRFFKKHPYRLSPREGYLIINTTMDNKNFTISPAKGSEIESIVLDNNVGRFSRFDFNDIHTKSLIINMGKRAYKIYAQPIKDKIRIK